MKKITILYTFIFVFIAVSTQAQRISWVRVNTVNQWENFLQKTQETGYIRLVLICNDESPICKDYKRQQFRGNELITYLNNYFLMIEVDAYQEFGQLLLNKFNLPGYPMAIFLDVNENIIGRLEGYQTADSIFNYSKHVRERQVLYPKLCEAYINGGLSMKGFVELVSIETINHGTVPNQVIYDEMVDKFGADLLDLEMFIDLLCRYGVQVNHPLFNAVQSRIFQLKKNSDFDAEAFYVNTFNRQMAKAIATKSEAEYQELEQKVLPLNPDTSTSLGTLIYRTRKIFLFETQQFTALNQWILNHAEKMGQEKSKFLLSEALDLMELGTHEAEMADIAKSLINESIKLGDEVVKRVYLANAYVLAKEFTEARGEIEKAMQMASTNQQGRLLGMLDAIKELQLEHEKELARKKAEEKKIKEEQTTTPTEK